MFSSYIIDFGLCKLVLQNSSSKALLGVLLYIAPEVLYAMKRNIFKSDIYSFRIIMPEVFTEYPPYHNILHNKDLATHICLGYKSKIRCKVLQLFLDLMNKCLNADPQN
ncbi:kinase-like domain-containing protein [Gigaspora rosea]|uniref:Kinase-like domain-containing protein n=1 Tax=Gigaspora rosea TaxID=44941 RepID=A0A397VMB2_9GLOM|nr:kinase-like domain-containing protein [Gigaspora rosea]